MTIGGDRVGYVSAITATRTASGRDIAVLHLTLERSIAPLPADSTDLVRPVSPLGLKYLEITRGRGSRMLPANGSLPLSATHKPVEIDDLFNIFNARTRHAEQTSLFNVGGGFAGRGAELNATLAGLNPLVRHVLPVMSTLLAPSTQLRALFPSLEQAAHEVLPVAARQAHLFAALDETFTPLSSQSAALRAAITGGPPALANGHSPAARPGPHRERHRDVLQALPPDVRRARHRIGQPRAGCAGGGEQACAARPRSTRDSTRRSEPWAALRPTRARCRAWRSSPRPRGCSSRRSPTSSPPRRAATT